ncbi:MAG: molybdate ABC transporter substrate-binding protein [Epsilonproteobacteria bacterium]|nr:molybdate ABC transporter substrate-binding protein [Campylobacterota bacterium]
MKIIIFFILLLSSLHATTITVAVAANIGYAMKDLTTAFYKDHPDLHVKVIIGSSGKLSAQIQHNAPYDLFLSANVGYPQKLYEHGYTINKPVIYAKGKLILFSKKERNFDDGLLTLLHKDIIKIAIANPKTAPYGVAAKEALLNAGLYTKLLPKFVYGESIAQTMLYALRATDIGIVAKSAVFTPTMKHFQKHKNWIEVSTKYYDPIPQAMVILKHASNKKSVFEFYTFLLSPKAQRIFEHFGYVQGDK